MERRGGWRLSALQRPAALHFCFTNASAGVVDALLADLRAVVDLMAAGEEGGGACSARSGGGGGSAPLCGACDVVPDRSIVGEALEIVQEVLLQA